MAFAATSVKRINLGGGLKLTVGLWTGVVGDSTGTVTVEGGQVYGFQFWDNASGAYVEAPVSVAAGSASNTLTVTIENVATVNTGKFMIWHA